MERIGAVLILALASLQATSAEWLRIGEWDTIELIETNDSTFYLVDGCTTFDLGNAQELKTFCKDITQVWEGMQINDAFEMDCYKCTKLSKNVLGIECAKCDSLMVDISVFKDILAIIKQ